MVAGPDTPSARDVTVLARSSQIVTIGRARMESLAATLPRALMREVDAGLRWFLQLES